MKTHANRLIPLALTVSLLSACGGGGGGSDSSDSQTTTPEITVPSALAAIGFDPDSTFDGTGVNVAAYDSGVNISHDEFANVHFSQFSKSFYSYVDVVGSTLERYYAETPNDDYDEDYSDTNSGNAGHGTAVASTIVGAINGVARDANFQMQDVNNYATQDGSYNVTSVDPISVSPDVTAALLHIADKAPTLGTDFANLSLTRAGEVIVDPSTTNRATYDNINATNVAMIVAAGNEALNYADIYVNTSSVSPCSDAELNAATGYEKERCLALKYDRGTRLPIPLIADLKNMMVYVSAVDANNALASYSNHPGDSCELQERWISAPGTVQAAAYDSDTGEVTKSGTSFAAPLVTGAAAAVKEKFSGISDRAVLRLLLSTADRSFKGYNAAEFGQGILDLKAALAANPADYADGVPGNLRSICP